MQILTIALFGEAEKGDFQFAYHFQSLPQLVDCLGNPPAQSKGLFLAIQTLLYRRDLIFFRVREEGFSVQDYMQGLKFFETPTLKDQIAAICIPGVGDREIIETTVTICKRLHSILITTESDLYDYLTSMSAS